MIYTIIVIFLLLFFASSPKQFVPFSHTSLGRLLSVVVIVFFTKKSMVLGVISCIAIIMYCRIEEFKYLLNIPEEFLWEMTYVPYSNDMYEQLNDEITYRFRKDNCTDGKLLFKGTYVNPEMAEHVFPSIQFTSAPCDPCNARCNFTILQNKLHTENRLRERSSK